MSSTIWFALRAKRLSPKRNKTNASSVISVERLIEQPLVPLESPYQVESILQWSENLRGEPQESQFDRVQSGLDTNRAPPGKMLEVRIADTSSSSSSRCRRLREPLAYGAGKKPEKQ